MAQFPEQPAELVQTALKPAMQAQMKTVAQAQQEMSCLKETPALVRQGHKADNHLLAILKETYLLVVVDCIFYAIFSTKGFLFLLFQKILVLGLKLILILIQLSNHLLQFAKD